MIPYSRHPEGRVGGGLSQVGRALRQSVRVAEQPALTEVAPLHPGKRYSPGFCVTCRRLWGISSEKDSPGSNCLKVHLCIRVQGPPALQLVQQQLHLVTQINESI